MRRLVIFTAFVVLSLTIVASVTAQADCSGVVTQAIQQLSMNCGDMARNSACYGYNHVTATFMDALTPEAFTHPNDRVDLASLQSISTSPLDLQTSQWGIAVLKAQANIPNALPGQLVTFLLLGDVTLQTGMTQGSNQAPMTAVYFTTGITGTKCNGVPDSSLIIQGPKDVTVSLNVNGANVMLGSTAIFRSTPNSSMSCGVIDGEAHVGADQDPIPSGFAARVPLDASLNANGDWGGNQPIADQDAAALQVLKNLPQGILNYTPDVPTPDEVNLLGALDPKLVVALDPATLNDMVHILVDEGATAANVSVWDDATLRAFIANNAAALAAATPIPASEGATAEAPSDTLQSVLDALDAYLAQAASS